MINHLGQAQLTDLLRGDEHDTQKTQGEALIAITKQLRGLRTAIYATKATDWSDTREEVWEAARDAWMIENEALRRKARKWKRRAQEWQSPTIEALKKQRNDGWDAAKSNYDRAEKAEAELAGQVDWKAAALRLEMEREEQCDRAEKAESDMTLFRDNWQFVEKGFRDAVVRADRANKRAIKLEAERDQLKAEVERLSAMVGDECVEHRASLKDCLKAMVKERDLAFESRERWVAREQKAVAALDRARALADKWEVSQRCAPSRSGEVFVKAALELRAALAGQEAGQ